MNKKKIAVAGAASVAAVAAVAAGAFAFFSDTAEGTTSGTAGQVDVEISNDMELSNSDNINPGDNDPDKPEDSRPGTPHDLTFAIANSGNKSIMTRNIITLSVKDAAGAVDMDPSVYRLLSDAAGTELVAKYYSADGVDFTADKPENCKYVRYITTQVALDGKVGSTGQETEDGIKEGAVGNGATVGEGKDNVSYAYTLMMGLETTDEYELSKLQIDLEVQAMQYRNTNDAAWDTIFTDTIVAE